MLSSVRCEIALFSLISDAFRASGVCREGAGDTKYQIKEEKRASETQNGKAAASASDKVCYVIRVRRQREVHRRQIVNADGHVSRLLPRQMSEPQASSS